MSDVLTIAASLIASGLSADNYPNLELPIPPAGVVIVLEDADQTKYIRTVIGGNAEKLVMRETSRFEGDESGLTTLETWLPDSRLWIASIGLERTTIERVESTWQQDGETIVTVSKAIYDNDLDSPYFEVCALNLNYAIDYGIEGSIEAYEPIAENGGVSAVQSVCTDYEIEDGALGEELYSYTEVWSRETGLPLSFNDGDPYKVVSITLP